MKPDFGIFLAGHKVVQFFADKVVLFLSYLILAFIVIDSFINLLPNGRGTVICFIDSNSVSSGQQSYINEYCADHVPGKTYMLPILVFGQGLVTVLLHYAWYSMVLYCSSVHKKTRPAQNNNDININCFCSLQFFYCFKNILQLFLAAVAMSLSFHYEFGPGSGVYGIEKNFNCSVKDIKYLAEPGTVQCLYNSIALNDVFISFYGVTSGCVVLVTFLGFVDICARRDIKKKAKCCSGIRECLKACCWTACCKCWRDCWEKCLKKNANEPAQNKNRCCSCCLTSCSKNKKLNSFCGCLKSWCWTSSCDCLTSSCGSICSSNTEIVKYCLNDIVITMEESKTDNQPETVERSRPSGQAERNPTCAVSQSQTGSGENIELNTKKQD